MGPRLRAAASLAAVLATASAAHAQPAGLDALEAGRLFHEAEQLFEAGKVPEACARFAESHAREPRLGTLLNLAFCHEREGRTATAYGEFQEALLWALARQQKDREAFAREHLAALEKRQSFLLVDRPDTPPAGLEVRLDGRVLPPTRWGVPSAVDPGMHTLVATAPYKEAQPLVFFVEEGPATRFVRIPALLDAPPINVPATEAARPPRDPAPTSSDTAATVAFATGGVALTVAVACAVRSAIAAADACPGGVCNDSSAGDAATARDFAVAAVASTGAALLAAGAGAWLLLEKPAALTARRGAPSWGVGGVPGGAALRVGGVF